MNFQMTRTRALTRRHFFCQCGTGLGAMALNSLLGRVALASENPSSAGPLAPKKPMRSARAKRVIYLHMSGAPPQMDLFDYKPKLKELNGTPCPKEFFEGKRLAFIKGHPKLLGSPHKFVQVGQAGTWVTELLPRFGEFADDVTMIHSMYTEEFNHAPAELLLFTGASRFGGASMGSWVTYGLGSENQNLPGFIVLVSGGTDPTGGKALWSSGYLPSVYQGVQCRSVGDPILYTSNPDGMSREVRRRSLDALKRLNEFELKSVGDPETLTRISQFELAFLMQVSVPEVMDISKEPASMLEMYGAAPGKASFANNCLLARRLVEQGVRFVQLFDWGWDIHGTGQSDDLMTAFPKKCRDIDQPVAALLKDLKQRGLLEDTLVVWGGEFGRTSMNEERDGSAFLGRDHHPGCFTIWLAGGGVKPGQRYGATDELGYTVVENKVHVHDLQATLLHLLGLDPHKLSFQFQGLDQRLIGPTDEPQVVKEILA
ncbi:MAG: DUF1501 domain-containing protein [Verrucomicrobia bacterium]|nr:DUF1501 domain-containing protein [Verrucomicrobiota bacterium]